MAVTRVVRVTRSDDDSSDALLALVALPSLLPRPSVPSVLPRRAVPSVSSRHAVPSALPRRAVLSAADVGGGGAVVHPRPINELLGIDLGGCTLFTSRERVLQIVGAACRDKSDVSACTT